MQAPWQSSAGCVWRACLPAPAPTPAADAQRRTATSMLHCRQTTCRKSCAEVEAARGSSVNSHLGLVASAMRPQRWQPTNHSPPAWLNTHVVCGCRVEKKRERPNMHDVTLATYRQTRQTAHTNSNKAACLLHCQANVMHAAAVTLVLAAGLLCSNTTPRSQAPLLLVQATLLRQNSQHSRQSVGLVQATPTQDACWAC